MSAATNKSRSPSVAAISSGMRQVRTRLSEAVGQESRAEMGCINEFGLLISVTLCLFGPPAQEVYSRKRRPWGRNCRSRADFSKSARTLQQAQAYLEGTMSSANPHLPRGWGIS